MYSYIILVQIVKVKTEIAKVPVNVPIPNKSWKKHANTIIGRVLKRVITIRLLTVMTFEIVKLADRKNDTGRATTQPITEPRIDMMMVSSIAFFIIGQ